MKRSLMASGERSNLYVGTIRPPHPLLTHRSIGTGSESARLYFVWRPASVTDNTLSRIATSSDAPRNSI